jgi:LuxR family maltose regulon positive regulatory protein
MTMLPHELPFDSLYDLLIQTKLCIPQAHPVYVPRERLTTLLHQAATTRLTLISAVGGAGKTSLLSGWARAQAQPLAWLTLESVENDLGQFVRYVVAALQMVAPQVGSTALAMLRTTPSFATEAILTTLINDLSQLHEPIVLVIDDYQTINAQSIHDVLAFLLDHLPPGVRLVLATRTDPPLPLARLRARGQLLELRTDDLRFTVEEAANFFRAIGTPDLSIEALAQLHARTEGWAAGLQLAAVSLQAHPNDTAFIAAFSGTHHHVDAYLLEEVFDQQSTSVQQFLLRTAVLVRLSGDLCDAVTGGPSGQAMLERLYRANLFIEALDSPHQWYRYHQLFAEFLLGRLARSGEGIADLHRRASAWYARAGLIDNAIGHALEAGDYETAADLIGRIARPMIHQRFQITRLHQWLQALPEAQLRAQPRLGAIYARVLFLMRALFGIPERAAIEAQLDAVERSIVEHGGATHEEAFAELLLVRAELALQQGGGQQALALAQQALDALTDRDTVLRCVVLQLQGYIHLRMGHARAADPVLARAHQLSQDTGHLTIALYALSDRGDALVLQGKLREAEAAYQQAIASGGATYEPLLMQAQRGLATVYLERMELDAAEREAETARRLAAQLQTTFALREAALLLVRIAAARRDWRAAEQQLRVVEDLAPADPQHPARRTIAAYRTLNALASGTIHAALTWMEETPLPSASAIPFARELEHRTRARVLVSVDRYADAADLAARLVAVALDGGRARDAAEALVVLAISQQKQGRRAEAAAALERALALAAPGGLVRIFAEADLEPLLSDVAAHSGHMDFVGRILAARSGQTGHAALLVESLTARELAVLRLIAAGLSNQEIADELVVAIGTVGKYTNNIFTKLGVRNRTQAVERSRVLGILSHK